MNKKETNNIKELITNQAVSYYYNKDMSILKGIEYTCKALNYPEYYIIVNKTILNEALGNRYIKYMQYVVLVELMESVNEYIPITDTIKDNNINEFIDILEIYNNEIEYINKDTFTANVNKIRYIKRVD